MLTLTSEYALQAVIYLARHEDEQPIPGREIAEHAQIPPRYLSKVLGDLVRSGVLDSSPGKTGGFALRRSSRETVLYDVLSPFEQFDRRRCPFSSGYCDDAHPCLAHDDWSRIVESQASFFRDTSVYDVAVRQES